MGHKVHPRSQRLGILYTWSSKWFSPKQAYSDLLRDDVRIREYVQKKLVEARVESVEIERSGKGTDVTVNIHTAKPGLVIGRGGAGIETLKAGIENEILKGRAKANVNIHEVRQPGRSAAVIAQSIASDIVRRIPFRRAVRQALEQIERSGAKGAKIKVSGRLNGADIARTEIFNVGSVPLHTLRANIDYAQAPAHTTYGAVGVTVWIYKGEVFDPSEAEEKTSTADVLDTLKKISARRGKPAREPKAGSEARAKKVD